MINKRSSGILSFIINSKKPVTIKELSDNFQVSPRTIRYDLENIDDFLNQNNFPLLDRKPSVGISYECSFENLRQISSVFNEMSSYDYIMSQEERVRYIICELLQNNGFITMDKLSEEMSVSKGTLLKDIEESKSWIEKNGLKLKSIRGRGMKVIGEEKLLRKAATKVFGESFDTIELLQVMKESFSKKEKANINIFINKLFKDIDIAYIERCIAIAEEQMEATFSDEAFNALLIHLAIAVKRIQLGRDIVMDKEEVKTLRKLKEFSVASAIAKMIEDGFNVSVPVEEIGYITIHLLGSNVTTVEELDKDNWLELRFMASKIIEEMENRTGYYLKQDQQLFNGLLQHLRPAVYRLIHGIEIKNPLIEEIKDSYGKVFSHVKKSVSYIEEKYNKRFSDEEIGYFTLHFQAVIEKLKDNKLKKPDVLVVCATGIGTSKMVSARLEAIFDVNIVDNISYREVEKALSRHPVDVIVSTIPINVKDIKSVQVNPFLTEKNIAELNLIFQKAKKSSIPISDYKDEINIDEIIDIIKESCTIENLQELEYNLTAYLKEGAWNKTSRKKPELKDILKEQCISLNAQVKDWEEAVRLSGELLLKNNYVKESYIEAMVKTVKEMGPYIVILPGIAMPHARPEDGVREIGISIVTLKEAVSFGSYENDPVKVIIAIASTDHISHMKALSQLMNVMENENFLQNIIKAKKEEEVIKYMQNLVQIAMK